jgi:hypothetical protein
MPHRQGAKRAKLRGQRFDVLSQRSAVTGQRSEVRKRIEQGAQYANKRECQSLWSAAGAPHRSPFVFFRLFRGSPNRRIPILRADRTDHSELTTSRRRSRLLAPHHSPLTTHHSPLTSISVQSAFLPNSAIGLHAGPEYANSLAISCATMLAEPISLKIVSALSTSSL